MESLVGDGKITNLFLQCLGQSMAKAVTKGTVA